MNVDTHQPTSHSPEVIASWEKTVRKVVEYIDASLNAPLTLDSIAGEVSMSPSHLRQVFSLMVGERLGEYVRRRRLEKAALAMMMTDEPITQIALGNGFESPAAFSRSFSKHFDMSPRKFRQRRQLPQFSKSKVSMPQLPVIDVTLREDPAWCMAYRAMVGGDYGQVAVAAVKLIRWARRKGILADPCRVVIRAYDDDRITADAMARFDVGVVIDRVVDGEAGIAMQEIPARFVASSMFHGNSADHSKAWWEFGVDWVLGNAYDYAELASYDFMDVEPGWLGNTMEFAAKVMRRDWKYRTEMVVAIKPGKLGSVDLGLYGA